MGRVIVGRGTVGRIAVGRVAVGRAAVEGGDLVGTHVDARECSILKGPGRRNAGASAGDMLMAVRTSERMTEEILQQHKPCRQQAERERQDGDGEEGCASGGLSFMTCTRIQCYMHKRE